MSATTAPNKENVVRPTRLSAPLVLLVLVACATEPRTEVPSAAGEPVASEPVAAVQRGPDQVFVEIKGVT